MRTIKYILLFHLILFCYYAQSQVRTNFNNEALISNQGRFAKGYKTQIDFELPAKNIKELLDTEKKEQLQSNNTKRFRLAVPVSVNLDIAKLTSWTYDNGYAYGKFTIKMNGALSASINFDQFYLPNETEMYVYNENGNMITGPVTKNENNTKKIWGSWVYRGAFLTIEIKTPISTLKQLLLHSNNIAYGYKEVYAKVGGFGQSGPCEINVICPLGNGWEPERNSVALILSDNGRDWCSGSMIMNTCNTNRPFFLTANHCYAPPGEAIQNVAAWRFTFQAWSPTCPNPGVDAEGVTYNGSTLRANWANSDFCLVELNNIPPVNSGINYAGWSRQTNAATSGVGIHHPAGDVMKISSYTTPLVREDDPVRCDVNAVGVLHWVVQWNQGVTEGGSSGSPLFDQNHRIVGQLSGGPSSCPQPANCRMDMYGRFDNSWTGGGTNATRLSNWLDPNNSGAMTTNTSNITNLAPSRFAITGDNSFCNTSNNYTITNLPQGATVQWQATPQGVVIINSPTSPQTAITKQTDGVITLTATISNICGGQITVSKPDIFIGTILVDAISIALPFADPNNLECNTIYKASGSVSGSYQPTAYRWTINPEWTIITNPANASINFAPNANNSTSGYLGLSVQNACGWSAEQVLFMQVSCSNNYSMSVSPNPVASEIVATVQSQNVKAKEKDKKIEKIDFTLYDVNTGMVVKRWSLQNGQKQYRLTISGIKKGQYVLQAAIGTSKPSVKIILK